MDIHPLLLERHGSEIIFRLSPGPGIFRRAERKETIDGLERTPCDSLFHSEMVLGKNIHK